ncbi:MAG TPA: hypothetical protein PK385_09540 [Spirochaetota bacterium]|nr:hypothetical protein [Spirochaetota bacterium]HOS33564.1 hypothetical protein [Spirochaetota bacterium]HOS56288.1 hypothetical protein [Spirochaetota bacterium]HQF78744.1 hypothetical protein [Spirochaetota bacterium]HQH31764.1 hypothetical protein [Spirochaetota bacterium]
MKKNIIGKIIASILLFATYVAILIACEPVTVSVNSKGEVAFARGEGVFFMDFTSGKLNLLDWNYGSDAVPVLVKWAQDEKSLAFTVKDNKDSQETKLYKINLDGKKSRLYSTSKVITHIEGTKDYISVAQAGEDSDMGVADIVQISARDGMSKIILSNVGDFHKWLDEKNIVYFKIIKKNPDNSDIYLAELQTYNIEDRESKTLVKALVNKIGAVDCYKTSGVVFTAINAGSPNAAMNFTEGMSGNSYAFRYDFKTKALEKLSNDIINYVNLSPDGTKLLVKNKTGEYDSAINLSYIDLKNKSLKTLIYKSTGSISSNSSTVQVYPVWKDNNTVLYWNLNNVYGSNGQSLDLMSVTLDKMVKANLQNMINAEVAKIVEKKGGY